MKKQKVQGTKKLSVKVATVRTLRESLNEKQLEHVAGGYFKPNLSGTPDNC